jgi:hypothetical protein
VKLDNFSAEPVPGSGPAIATGFEVGDDRGVVKRRRAQIKTKPSWHSLEG